MSRAFKRLMDALVSATALVLLVPAIATIGLVIWISMGRPILFKQKRAGNGGRAFTLFKFRTMDDARDTRGQFLPDKHRLTKVGIILRRFSLDELPQLWNVLIGDMSLVGPRPLLVEYLPRYSPEQARRHEVRPGITGWAQVNGRNALDWQQKFQLDVWYVNNWNIRLDAKIIWSTMQNIFKQEGISQRGHSTMPEFTGNDRSGL